MNSRRIIRIDSDGFARETVISTDDGKVIDQVTHVRWEIDVHRGVAEAELEIRGMASHVIAELTAIVFHCPICDHSQEHRCHDPSPGLPE